MANYQYMGSDELIALLDSPESAAKLTIVDCRDTDRSCGYFINSIHAPTISWKPSNYSDLAKSLWDEKKEIVVFHCAQSLIRGPKGANRFATAQKELGYPLPVIYVLRGGWEAFYATYGSSRQDLTDL